MASPADPGSRCKFGVLGSHVCAAPSASWLPVKLLGGYVLLSNARSSDKMKDVPVLTACHVLKEHPFEIRQEDKVPELAAAIRECGI